MTVHFYYPCVWQGTSEPLKYTRKFWPLKCDLGRKLTFYVLNVGSKIWLYWYLLINQKNVLTSRDVSVRLYSYSLLVPESGSSRLLHAQRYLGQYCSIFLQKVYRNLSQATLLQIFTIFASQMEIKGEGKVATWTLNEKKTWFVNNQRNRGIGGLTVKCQEGDVRNLDLTHTSYLWLFLPKFSFPQNSHIISNWTLYTIFPNKHIKLKQRHKLLEGFFIGPKSNHCIAL